MNVLPRMCFSFGGNAVPYCSHYKSDVHLSDSLLALMFIMTHFCLLTEYAGRWRSVAQKELSEVMNESPRWWLMAVTQLRQENYGGVKVSLDYAVSFSSLWAPV